MIFYPTTTDDNYLSILFLSVNSEGELVASASAGAHLGPGDMYHLVLTCRNFL